MEWKFEKKTGLYWSPDKFVIIKGNVVSVATTRLIASKDYESLPVLPLSIDSEYVKLLRPRKNPDYVTAELLQEQPVTMFESSHEPGRYHRHDGSHRIIGAYIYLHMTEIPAKWGPMSLWQQYLYSQEVKYRRMTQPDNATTVIETETRLEPEVYQTPLFADPEGPGAHYERNFRHPSISPWDDPQKGHSGFEEYYAALETESEKKNTL